MKVTLILKTVLLAMFIALAVGMVYLPTVVAQEESAEEAEEEAEVESTEATSEEDIVEIESVVVSWYSSKAAFSA